MRKSALWMSGSWTCLWIASLAACGGGDATTAAAGAEDAGRASIETVGTGAVITPLLDDEGNITAVDANAAPDDPAARTRSGYYASPAQARQLADALGADAIEINVPCCSPENVDTAVGVVWGLQAAHNLPSETPVLVRGSDLRLAAAVANRLDEGGLTHVWLVTP